jgi:hypothetical protein
LKTCFSNNREQQIPEGRPVAATLEPMKLTVGDMERMAPEAAVAADQDRDEKRLDAECAAGDQRSRDDTDDSERTAAVHGGKM